MTSEILFQGAMHGQHQRLDGVVGDGERVAGVEDAPPSTR